MGFWELLEVASAPVLQIFIISTLGAFMATDYFNILTEDARKHINKIVFLVFTPALMFANLAKTVTFQDIISWWFMPINIGIIFTIGATLGWIVVKILKPEPHIEGLVIASCSAGNLGNLPLIIIPAICNENGSPFGDRLVCKSVGLSYASFSMALGGFFIWSHTYHLLRSSTEAYIALQAARETFSNKPNCDLDANRETHLLKGADDQDHLSILVPSTKPTDEEEAKSPSIVLSSRTPQSKSATFRDKLMGVLHNIVKEFSAPPTIAAIVGLIFGAIPWLKHFVIGDDAPLRVVEDATKLLGDGTIPCITLILGGNLYQGLKSGRVRPLIIIGIIIVRYIILPVIGLGVVRAADSLGLLPDDPLFQYVLMVQFTLPPAMNIGTITQLFNVGQEECSIILLWTYLVAALSLTVWSTVFLYILA